MYIYCAAGEMGWDELVDATQYHMIISMQPSISQQVGWAVLGWLSPATPTHLTHLALSSPQPPALPSPAHLASLVHDARQMAHGL